jgi:YhcH/YjgK/YiaL family protein
MILDELKSTDRYLSLNNHFASAFDFLLSTDLKELPVGRFEIDGDQVYAMVQNVQGRSREESTLESHKRYIDIQLVLDGSEGMGWKSLSSCEQLVVEYNDDKDVQRFSDEPDTILKLKAGQYAIFFPEDAHMPLLGSGEIHKVVIKVATD